MLSTEYFLKWETLRPHITGSLILFCFRHTMTGMAWLLWKRLRRGNRYYPQTLVSPAKQGQLSLREETFGEALAEWFTNGPRIGVLKSYPYRDSDEYIKAYCKDIIATV